MSSASSGSSNHANKVKHKVKMKDGHKTKKTQKVRKEKKKASSKMKKKDDLQKNEQGLVVNVAVGSSGADPSGSDMNVKENRAASVCQSTSNISLASNIAKLSLNDHSNASTTAKRFTRRAQSVPGRLGGTSLAEIAQCICSKQMHNVVVVVGAGISTSSGIPDFRTPGSGLYDNLQQYRIPTPQDIFDIEFFETNPRPFFTLARELYPGRYEPNRVHYFLRLLHEKRVLRRIYTQNIDGLELIAGIPPDKLIEAHGSFRSASCVRCRMPHCPKEIRKTIFSNKLPRCKAKKCWGIVKPDIVFFGEDLPRRFYYYLADFPQADLLLIMGTSLEVQPFADTISMVGSHIPRVLFNKMAVGPFRKRCRAKDITIEGDIVHHVQKFCDLLGWTNELDALVKSSEAAVQRELAKLSCGDNDTDVMTSTRPATHDVHMSNGPNRRVPHGPLQQMPTRTPNMNNSNVERAYFTRVLPSAGGASGRPAQRLPAFHAQTTLYRTSGKPIAPQPRLRLLSSESSEDDSSDESASSSSSDDT